MRHLRCILAVAEHLHFSRAADALDIAAPSLTRTVQEAERLIGARLFYRTKRTVELTAAGAAYVDQARIALDHLTRASEVARAAERGELGRLEIGYVSSAAYSGVLQQTIGDFRAGHPRVDIAVREVLMERAGVMLEDAQLDFAFFRPPMPLPESIVSTTVAKDTFVLAVPDDSPLALFDEVSPAQLRHESFVLPEQPYGAMEVGRRGRFVPDVVGQPGTLTSVLARVSLGGCVAVVPGALSRCVALPRVVYKTISGRPIATEIALASRKHDRAPAVRAFLAWFSTRAARQTVQRETRSRRSIRPD
ncbi:LysR family transcriptional regulator [Pararobbsia silviterrae]|uniref:LysR family transcriptional regulator n=1 Tax=Pararobbsia silviterrae TaxID=1792498 RepID=A0A494XMJ8_9BURK|nr:LysR family transcriptional regulator [Pararobbsia silviterrae]RKP51910.1 LysR family transcriptional regulator [Pararobbsia silviterrae]